MFVNGRTATFQVDSDTHRIFAEGPCPGSFDDCLFTLGNPVWFGSLGMRDETKAQADIRKLLKMATMRFTNDGCTADYDGWEFEIRYAPNRPGTPHTILTTNHQRPTKNDFQDKSRYTIIHNWLEKDGVKFPKKIESWDLSFHPERGWFTFYRLADLQSIGPKQTISDRDGDYFTDIANGTRLQVDNHIGIEFIWQDGEIVCKVDNAKLATIVEKRFFPSTFRRFVWMGMGGAALVALGWVIWRWSRGGGGLKKLSGK